MKHYNKLQYNSQHTFVISHQIPQCNKVTQHLGYHNLSVKLKFKNS